jgi:hypothetical protein
MRTKPPRIDRSHRPLPSSHECQHGISGTKDPACRDGIPVAPQGAGRGVILNLPMPRTRKRSRYSLDDARFEIAKMRDQLGLQDKDVYLGIGMGQTTFSRKMAGVRDFEIAELGDIADFFSRETRRPLPGWPFLSERECAYIEARVPEVGGRGPDSPARGG